MCIRLVELPAAPHSSIREDDSRRSALYRYITNLRDTGDYGFDILQIAAVAYLKNLDKFHDDRAARAAADRALAECLKSSGVQSSARNPADRAEGTAW